MPECRYTLLRSGRAELEEKKSRFLAQSFFVRSEAEVAEILAAVRKEHYDARHVCSAYVLFGNPPLEKSSDDGEPAKTAGLPMLDLLRAASLCNTLVTVTRYFGGIKLGTGGLVRAYTAAAKGALEQAVIAELLPAVRLSLTVDYGFYGKVSLCLLFRAEDSARFLAALTELSGGSLTPDSTETLTCVERDGKLTPIQLSAC